MEIDSAKSTHEMKGMALVDYNRSGQPLLEIVTRPHIHHPTDARLAIKELQDTLQSLSISKA
jgi:aspartyl-tRNA(Asn)/glutamyl-tRNA(Gln) amidotransferase subunit B